MITPDLLACAQPGSCQFQAKQFFLARFSIQAQNQQLTVDRGLVRSLKPQVITDRSEYLLWYQVNPDFDGGRPQDRVAVADYRPTGGLYIIGVQFLFSSPAQYFDQTAGRFLAAYQVLGLSARGFPAWNADGCCVGRGS